MNYCVNCNTTECACMTPTHPSEEQSSLTDYDPNVRWAKHTIEIDLQLWAYKLTVTTTLGGNLKGFAVLEYAISNYLDALVKEQGDNPTLLLVNAAGDTMECQPDDEDLDLWIESMCVGLRIVKHEAEERAVKAAIARATSLPSAPTPIPGEAK